MAFDRALDKVEHQMRRLHERRVQRGKRPRDRDATGNGAARTEGVAVGDEDEAGASESAATTGPVIVKTKHFAVKPMTPEEAALQMDLLGHDFFMFRNADSTNAAVLYRRRDGALGLIEVTG